MTAIYTRLGRPAPRFLWVDSPAQALPHIRHLPTLDDLYLRITEPRPSGRVPLASDLAVLVAALHARLSAGLLHPDPDLTPARMNKRNDPWPELPASSALTAGVPIGVVLHQSIRVWLHRTVGTGLRHRVRDALSPGPAPVCWYGQHDVSWIAYYDILEVLGLARYAPPDRVHLTQWAELARSSSWWWPGETVCTVVERPAVIRLEPVPGARLGEQRLAQSGITYRDGWHPALR